MKNNLKLGKNNHFFKFYVGIMKCGKSEKLFKIYESGKRLNLETKLFRLEGDNRFFQPQSADEQEAEQEKKEYKGYLTRTGKEYPPEDVCIINNGLESLMKGVEEHEPKVILVEEIPLLGIYAPDKKIQPYMKKVADYIEHLVQEQNKIVIGTGLLSDSDGNEFFNIGQVAAKADQIIYMPPPDCTFILEDGSVCDNPATKTKYMLGKKEVAKIGDEEYEPRCRPHWQAEE